jgi:hypothetical protein
MSNLTKEELFNMIEALRERLDLLEGRPRGPISMTEARLAQERGDKATVKRFYMQESERLRNGSSSPQVRSGPTAVPS